MQVLYKRNSTKYLQQVHVPHVFLASAKKYIDFEQVQFYFNSCLDLKYEIEPHTDCSNEHQCIAVFWLKQYNAKKSVVILDRPKQDIQVILQEYLQDKENKI